jgi:hypothetical protein
MMGQTLTVSSSLKRIILALAVAALMTAMLLMTSANSANAKNTMPTNPGQMGGGSYGPPQASGAFKGEEGGSEVLHPQSRGPSCVTHYGGEASGTTSPGC